MKEHEAIKEIKVAIAKLWAVRTRDDDPDFNYSSSVVERLAQDRYLRQYEFSSASLDNLGETHLKVRSSGDDQVATLIDRDYGEYGLLVGDGTPKGGPITWREVSSRVIDFIDYSRLNVAP